MNRFYLTFWIVLSGVTIAFAQDPQFSQFYQQPLYLNPGYTGITEQQRVAVNNRIQWPNLPQAFTTYSASYDIYVDELRSGLGLLVTTDNAGSASWRTTTANLMYSYKVKLSEKFVFSPGLSFGYGLNGIDRNKLIFGDQVTYNQDNGSSTNIALKRLGNQQYFDFASGFVLYSRKAFFGVAFSHMNRPNISVLNETSRLPMKTTINGGLRIPLYSGIRSVQRNSYLTPSFIYMIQGPTTQLNLGLNYHIDPLSIGFWYRGKPYQKTDYRVVNQDAIIFAIGLYLKDFTIGYSYDFSISKLSTSSGGAHEISIVYEFSAKPLHRGVKKRNRLIPCPTFNNKPSHWK